MRLRRVHPAEGTGTPDRKEDDARTGRHGVSPHHLPHFKVSGQDLSLSIKLKKELLPFKIHTRPPPYQKH